MYETPTPDLGLTNSNISMLINHIRQRLGYTSATDAATEETTASATDAATEKTTASATDAATEKTTAAYEPCFHLHRLKTEGLTASVSVGGVDLPLERTLVPIADIKIDDLTGDVRSNLAQFRELKAEGGGLAPIVGHVVEKLNERVVEQLSRETLDKGARLLSDTFQAAASEAKEKFNEFDADGDGTVSAEEIALGLWGRLVGGESKGGSRKE